MANHATVVAMFWLLITLLFIHSPVALAENGEYVLATGDVVKIKVYQEQDLSISTKIDGNGWIEYPLIGEIKLAGLTLEEAGATIDKALRGDYLVAPRVKVSIETYRSYWIFGAVKKPGKYEYRPGMTARTAIAIAGDFSKLASRRKVYIIRAGDEKHKEQKHKLDVPIGPGDTIRIKESLF